MLNLNEIEFDEKKEKFFTFNNFLCLNYNISKHQNCRLFTQKLLSSLLLNL